MPEHLDLDEIEARKSASFRAFDKWRFGDRAGYSDAEAYQTREGKESWSREHKDASLVVAKEDENVKLLRSTRYPTEEAIWRRKSIATIWQNEARENHGDEEPSMKQFSRGYADDPWFYSNLAYEYKLVKWWESLEPGKSNSLKRKALKSDTGENPLSPSSHSPVTY